MGRIRENVGFKLEVSAMGDENGESTEKDNVTDRRRTRCVVDRLGETGS